MPIKKKLSGQGPMTKAPAEPAKKSARRVAASAPKAAPEAAPKAAPRLEYTASFASLAKEREGKLGPPLDPRVLEGAAQQADSVVGQRWTVWSALDKTPTNNTWVFFEDGTLNHSSGTIGIWRQAGASIVAEINGRYSQYKGVISGREVSGVANNIVGKSWTWTATIDG